MSDFKDIWNVGGGGNQLTDEQLLAYLEGRLPEAERHAVEALLAEQGMESDALEGLKEIGVEEAQSMRRSLNVQLQQTLKTKRNRRRRLASQQSNIVAAVILLLLILICFAVLWMLKHR